MSMDTPDERMPQVISMAIASQSWGELKALDQHASVLMDLWDPEHLARARPAYQGRLNRLRFGLQLLEQGFRVSDHRGTALGQLLGWHIEPTFSGLLEEERQAWVDVLCALEEAGQPLAAAPEPDFDQWMTKDTWAWLVKNPEMADVCRELVNRGRLRVYVPPCPEYRGWPIDPTAAVLDENVTAELSFYWKHAIAQGYPLTGAKGLEWLCQAVEWDLCGQAIKAALATGQIDVRKAVPGGRPPLVVWMSDKTDFVSPVALLALLEFDITALDDPDDMARPLHALILEVLHLKRQGSPGFMIPGAPGAEEKALQRVEELVRAYRLSKTLDESLSTSSRAAKKEHARL